MLGSLRLLRRSERPRTSSLDQDDHRWLLSLRGTAGLPAMTVLQPTWVLSACSQMPYPASVAALIV